MKLSSYGRWVWWLLVVMTLATAVALTGSIWLGHRSLENSSQTLTTGQGQSLLDAIRGELVHPIGPWSKAHMTRLLASHESLGLRYVALFTHHGEVLCDAGDPWGEGFPREGRGELVQDGQRRVRMMMAARRMPDDPNRRPRRPPPPGQKAQPPLAEDPDAVPRVGPLRDAEGRPLHGPPDPRGDMDPSRFMPPGGAAYSAESPDERPPPDLEFGGEHPSPALVIEFVPLIAEGLRNETRRTAISAVVLVLVLGVWTVVLLLLLRHRDALEGRLEHARHLAALGEVSAVLAHQVRNPLASLKGHAQLLVESLAEGSERQRADRVVREARRLEELCTDLLDLVRSARLDVSDVDLRAWLDECVEMVDPARIVVDCEGAPSSWAMDVGKMQQVLVNVLDNAMTSADDGSPVHASARLERAHLVLEIRDHGPGIRAGEELKIFEPFVTGRARGTGLGLAVARRVVVLHGGSILASNHPRGGAVFRIDLPPRAARGAS